MDPSMLNWGLAAGLYCTDTRKVTIKSLDVLQPELPKGKQVRVNSKDLERALQLSAGLQPYLSEKPVIFAEIPVGSQSASGMKAYGICVGVLGALRASGTPFYEQTPTEVKLAGPGDKNATKDQMIDWAIAVHPDAPWPRYKKNGELLVSREKAEHMADAIASIYAGLRSTSFQQALALMAHA
jgi:hypothetical protein